VILFRPKSRISTVLLQLSGKTDREGSPILHPLKESKTISVKKKKVAFSKQFKPVMESKFKNAKGKEAAYFPLLA